MTARLGRLEPLIFALPAAAFGAAAVALAYSASPLLPLALVVAAGALALALARPLLVLTAGLALIPLELLAFELGGLGVSPAEAMIVLSGAGWAARRLATGSLPGRWTSLTGPYLLLLLAMLMGLAVAVDAFLVVKTLVIWLCFFFVFQMLVADADTRVIRTLLTVLAFAGGIVGCIAVVGAGGAEQELTASGALASGRATGTFAHPNTLASFMAFALPAAVVMAVSGPRSLRSALALAAAASFAALALSLSRGGLIATAAAIGVMLAWGPFRRGFLALALIGLLAVVLGGASLGAIGQVETLGKRVSSITYSSQGADPRFAIWREAPQIVRDHPVIGVGTSQFAFASRRYGIYALDVESRTYDHAHNVPLTIAVELGLLGLAALAWLVIALARVLWQACTRSAGAARGPAFAVTAGLVAMALQAQVDFTIRTHVIAALVFIATGCAVVLARDPAEAEASP